MRYLALGDSYTIGESVPADEPWPMQLVHRLRDAGIDIADPHVIARTGWTTDELAAAIDNGRADNTLQPPYDLVSLLIGVNNQYRGRPAAEYRHEFAALLDQAISFAGGDPQRVFVLSIPDWGVTPFAARQRRNAAEIAAEIDTFNAINRAETENRGAAYVDITSISRQAATQPDLIANDDLHPSGQMYTAWVDLALPTVCALLTE